MQGGENHIMDGDETVLWRNTSPARLPDISAFRRRLVRVFVRVGFLLLYTWVLFVMWSKFRSDDFDLTEAAVPILIGIFGAPLGFFIGSRFRFSRPNRVSIPNKLTHKTLFIADPRDAQISVGAIKGLSSTYYEGSPGILLAIPGRTLALVTSERDALMGALLSLRPDLKAAS